MNNIRNFTIIAHIDHGKSTLADRMLEVTHTIEARKMKDQVLDDMELEREKGITIKMRPVRMIYNHSDRRIDADSTQTNAEENQDESGFLYKDLTYKIRGIIFDVRKKLGLGHKEAVYHNALEIEFKKASINFESKKNIQIKYEGKSIGTYQPDFVVEEKVLIELKALPEIGHPQVEQIWSYLKGCDYKLGLLVNFGSKDLEIKRVVYDSARNISASSASNLRQSAGVSSNSQFILNLIDTPGHIDFSYEVSRALKAVEGSILLVDATQGVQAQTLTTLRMAKDAGLKIIPVLSKIDSPLARIPEIKSEVARILDCSEDEILETSGKTGQGVDKLLEKIVEIIPPPKEEIETNFVRALVFDFQYSNHKGVIVFVRVTEGAIKKGDELLFKVANEKFHALEVGIFVPEEKSVSELKKGEIGYIVTGIKRPGIASVGDTITSFRNPLPPLFGYEKPFPVVWASVFPEDADDFENLKQALQRLRLSDSAFSFEEESSGSLGRGFRCGFLGLLHLEIITERLKREFNLSLVIATPTITYEITLKNGKTETIYSPSLFPEGHLIAKIREPWVDVVVICPSQFVGDIYQLLYSHEAEMVDAETFQDGRTSISIKMPLRELMRNFFDELKSVSSGYASLSYEFESMRDAEVTRMDILVADEPIEAFSRVVAKRRTDEEANKAVDKLEAVLPRQLFTTKIQAKVDGRIIASRTLSALRKDVTGYLYGGDVTRKKKLLEKQKKGKKKMLERGKGNVNIPHEVFLKMMKTGE